SVARLAVGQPTHSVCISKLEMLAEIDLSNCFIINNLSGSARCDHPAFVDDVRPVADSQRFAHVVVGNEDSDAALLEEADDFLDVEHGDRIDAGERLVEKDES